MHLMIDKSKYGHNTLYIYKSFRDENGKSTSKCVERLGRYDDLKKVHDDPIAWANAYVAELNKKERTDTFEDSKSQIENHNFYLQDIYRSVEVIANET